MLSTTVAFNWWSQVPPYSYNQFELEKDHQDLKKKKDKYGGVYLGQKDDLGHKNGKGAYIVNGTIWEGYFNDDQIIYGRCIHESGTSMATGSFKDWKLNGHAELQWNDGERYEGEFDNGLQHGKGRQI